MIYSGYKDDVFQDSDWLDVENFNGWFLNSSPNISTLSSISDDSDDYDFTCSAHSVYSMHFAASAGSIETVINQEQADF